MSARVLCNLPWLPMRHEAWDTEVGRRQSSRALGFRIDPRAVGTPCRSANAFHAHSRLGSGPTAKGRLSSALFDTPHSTERNDRLPRLVPARGLAVNARDAMPDGGTITISAGAEHPRASPVPIKAGQVRAAFGDRHWDWNGREHHEASHRAVF